MSNCGSGVELEAKCEGKTAYVWSRRPRWKDVFDGYLKVKKNDEKYEDEDPDDILEYLFEKPDLTDACGARLSIALLNAGINIDIDGDENITKIETTIVEEKKINDKNVTATETIVLKKITRGDISDGKKLKTRPVKNLKGKNAILRAEGMRHWLWKKKWGEADYIVYFPKKLKDLQKKFGGKKGVYIMRPKYPTKERPEDVGGGPGFNASGHCTLWTGKDVIGKHYAEREYEAFAAYLWELK